MMACLYGPAVTHSIDGVIKCVTVRQRGQPCVAAESMERVARQLRRQARQKAWSQSKEN